MIEQNEFIQWFEKQVKARWPKHNFDWMQIGDWHWRLREGFDLETLTEAVRKHKACDDFRTPSLKKVYDYAKTIGSRKSPKRQRADGGTRSASGIPEAHTFIMCIDKDPRGRGRAGWFVDIILWPFKTDWTPDDYQRVATEQARKYADFYGGEWMVFTHTSQLEMLQCAATLRGTKPLDLTAGR